VIDGKGGLDTFASTNLDFILRNKGIETVVLGGFFDQLLRRVDDAHRVRARVRGHHADGLRRRDLARGTRQRDPARLPVFSKPMSASEFIGLLG
jgi:hypothetical protein